MYAFLIDAHLSDGDRLATLDVFPLMGSHSWGLICLRLVHVYVLAHTL